MRWRRAGAGRAHTPSGLLRAWHRGGSQKRRGQEWDLRQVCPQRTPGQPPWPIFGQHQLALEVPGHLSPTCSHHGRKHFLLQPTPTCAFSQARGSPRRAWISSNLFCSLTKEDWVMSHFQGQGQSLCDSRLWKKEVGQGVRAAGLARLEDRNSWFYRREV